MSRRLVLAIVSAILLVTPLSGVAQAQPAPSAPAADSVFQAQGDVIPDQYIVVLKPGANPRVQEDDAERRLGTLTLFTYDRAIRGFAFRGTPQMAQALARHPLVESVVQDRLIQAIDVLPTGVDRIDAEVATGTGFAPAAGFGFGVAVLDTGIDLDHPDLNVAPQRKHCTETSADDGNGHGTHVAGTIGAKNGNGATTVVGVAEGVTLYAVKVLNSRGSGSWASVICGIDWVTANAAALNIKVANMSLGGSGSDAPSNADCTNATGDALHTAICRSVQAGVTYVVAAGNSGADLVSAVPATYSEVITVTALADYNGAPGGGGAATCSNYGPDDTFASFSNYATLAADLAHTVAAPGACIRSTYKNGGYATLSGTSMASPAVAGTAALFIAQHPGTTPAQVARGRQGIEDWHIGFNLTRKFY